MLFSKAEQERIKSAVQNAEAMTSGEIVTLVVKSSGAYRWVHWFWGTMGWAVGSCGIWLIATDSVWSFATHEILEVQCLFALVGSLLGRIPLLKRWTLPKKLISERVHRECLANFVATGMQETRDRTGILIYLSELEHRVEILADRGIHQHCGPDYWNEQVSHIAKGLRRGKGAESLIEAIGQIGKKLAEHFPPRDDDQNELDNSITFGHQSLPSSEPDPEN